MVAGPIRIIYDGRLPGNDGQTLVIEKPGSMPVSLFILQWVDFVRAEN